MIDFFKPEDFKAFGLPINLKDKIVQMIEVEHCTRIANLKLQNLIDEAPVVYSDNWNLTWYALNPENDSTHKARLMFIEELLKNQCDHYPAYGDDLEFPICRKCGVRLRTKWETAE